MNVMSLSYHAYYILILELVLSRQIQVQSLHMII
jgi:hypothetical protein